MSNSGLRSRPNAKKETPEVHGDIKLNAPDAIPRAQSGISVLDILRMLGGVFLLSSALSYYITNDGILWGYKVPSISRVKPLMGLYTDLTPQELSTYNGSDPSLPIYVAVNGSIYDVSASPRFYGQGAGYNVFAGRDASRAFVTGCLEEDLIPDLRGVEDMFVPMDLEQPPVVPEDATEAERKASRREWKLRREQARAVGRQKVRETIEIWVKTFDGGLKDKYWKVGHVKMPKDYKKNLGPPNKLCQRALDQRPRTSKEEVDVMSNLGKMS